MSLELTSVQVVSLWNSNECKLLSSIKMLSDPVLSVLDLC